jgi:transketolase
VEKKMSNKNDNLQLISDTIKTLSMDAIQKANSGHPGLPMGCSDIAAVLWSRIIRYNPDDHRWINRDRFILSAGHGSMLLYSLLHMSGFNISLDDIKNFRQLNSNTPGHPEFGKTDGVETTTGPLGQGFANGVGMSLASRLMGEEFPGGVIDHYIYGLVSDGDIMEGISSEAASLAGHMGLGNIIYIYDSNHISIEGDTALAFSEDITARFKACNWDVQEIDGHNFDEIEKAVLKAQKATHRPSLIIATTRIAKGSPNKEGSESSHGAPLGEDEVKATKENIGWDPELQFHVPPHAYEVFNERNNELKKEYSQWEKKFSDNIKNDLKKKWDSYFSAPDINSLRGKLPVFETGSSTATRSSSGKVLELLFSELPNLVGGSADLSPSNKTFIKGFSATGKNQVGRNMHFGIREHAMGAIQNGLAYYGGFIPFSATFLVFTDYMRPPIRLAALSKLHTIYVMTHDSFHVGEDGPTHQPIEHTAVLRAIPGLTVMRPADAPESGEAWISALEHTEGPVMMMLTRQNVPVIDRMGKSSASDLARGAYIIKDTEEDPDIIVLASGSEVHISMEAAEILKNENVKVRVVSFPSWELFDAQDDEYRDSILPAGAKYAVVEAGIKMGWERYAGRNALYLTLEHFGISAPGSSLAEKFGFTGEKVADAVRDFLE